MKDKERPKKEAAHSRLVGGGFKKQGNFQGLSWAAARPVTFAPTHQILKVYTDALTGFNHVHSPDGLNTILPLFQSCVLG